MMEGNDQTRGRIIGSAAAKAHPSLAMIKYWGKADTERNIPATPSLALTLDGLTTSTEVEVREVPRDGRRNDRVIIDGVPQPDHRFTAFFQALREGLSRLERPGPSDYAITARSTSDFPASAGLASSASGFAALTAASAAALGANAPPERLSAIARVGSASAARSFWGGFVRLDAGAEAASPVHDETWWPELRVVVVQTTPEPKSTSSRKAMEEVRRTSPFYPMWLEDAPKLMDSALAALHQRDLDELGPLMRQSYLRMFSTMLSANPPVIYWKPDSLEAIAACGELRSDGVSAWETMDAGPQLKVFCLDASVNDVMEKFRRCLPGARLRVCSAGGSPRVSVG